MNFLDKLKKHGLLGCLNGTGVTSENYKEYLYGDRMEWIEVEKRMPPKYETILFITYDEKKKCGCYYMGQVTGNGSWVPYGRNFGKKNVTHWMPLPQPPEKR